MEPFINFILTHYFEIGLNKKEINFHLYEDLQRVRCVIASMMALH